MTFHWHACVYSCMLEAMKLRVGLETSAWGLPSRDPEGSMTIMAIVPNLCPNVRCRKLLLFGWIAKADSASSWVCMVAA
jgi:hypothetical protein